MRTSAIAVARILVPQAAHKGDRYPDSPSERKTVDENIIPEQMKIASAIPPAAPRRLKTIPSGAARRTIARQIPG
jgi:hypothetical protein